MCTSIILFRKSASWPLIIGSNRDENLHRKSIFPGRHWKKYPNIIGGKDLEKNGSWIGINDNRLVAIIHNGISSNKITKFKYSRGNIVLEVLKYNSINEALNYISALNVIDYNYFNLFLADYKNCYFIKYNNIQSNIKIQKVKEGLSVMTDKDLNDKKDKKINYYHNLFSSSKTPNPSINNWFNWQENLSLNKGGPLVDNEKICFINKKFKYGTRSSSLIAISNKNIIFKATTSLPRKDNYIDVNFD